MFSLHDRSTRLCDGISRRELLRVGGLSMLGLSLPQLLQLQAHASLNRERAATFGKAKNVIYLWLQGGPPQHETFDPKPDAPAEIRGEFKPIATNVPGIQFSELLPRTAAIADKLAVVRSLTTHSDIHDSSGYWILTGYKYTGTQSRQISPTDWPYFGSIVKMLKPSKELPSYTSVWLPDVMRLNDNVQPAGQTGGFVGKRWDPERVIGDPSQATFQIEGLALPPEIPPLRLGGRQSLLSQVENYFNYLERGPALNQYDRQMREAFGVLTSSKARQAFDIRSEPQKVRDRYGRHKWGQCVLLARRLIEAGARLVHVNWPREPGDTAVNNPLWDTHTQNADRLQDVLCPMFDVTFTALIEDLAQRGLLSETLVVVIGEFGRTPKINRDGGRDHWGHVFSFALAGAGISGAQVYGSSDKIGGYPKSGKLEPQDLTATIFHLLGIGHDAMFPHPTGRPIKVTEGEPIYPLLGGKPATDQRTSPGGNLALVPEFSDALLLNKNFDDPISLIPVGTGSRLKGWQASPIIRAGSLSDGALAFGVKLAGDPGKKHVTLGYDAGKAPAALRQGDRALLTQEVRNPRAGKYVFTIQACGAAPSASYYRDVFLKNFTCKLHMFGYSDLKKDPRNVREFASITFQPSFADPKANKLEKFELTAILKDQDDGANHLNKGVGVAVVLEKTSPGVLDVAGQMAWIHINEVDLAFIARPRNDDVQV